MVANSKFHDISPYVDPPSHGPPCETRADNLSLLPPFRFPASANTNSAHRMGLKAAWINRPEAIMGVQGFEDIKPDWTFGNMEEFVDGLKSAKEEF